MRLQVRLSSRAFALAVATALLPIFSACVNVPAIVPRHQPALDSALGLDEQALTPALGVAWWQVFGDAKLDALVQRALESNPGLQLAAARVERASALAEAAGALGKPATGLGLDATRQRYSEHGLLPPPIAGSVRTSVNLQAGVSWEFDFFGRNRAQLRAALGAERAVAAESQAAAMLLSSQVVRGYVGLARWLEQRGLLQAQLHLREQAAELVAQRVAAGLDTHLELHQVQTPLPELRRQRQALDEQISLARHQLAALSAQSMDALDALAPGLPQLPRKLIDVANASLALDLLGRRPDVAAARWRVEAATADVSAARAQFYPNLNLNAFAGFSSIGLDNLLRAGSLQAGIGPALRLPIFDTGRLRAQLHGNVADLDAAVASYNASVVQAVHEASDALASVRSLGVQAGEQDLALRNAVGARELARQRQAAGLANGLALINADLAVLAQQRALADVQAQTLDSHVALIRALGGGWRSAMTQSASDTSKQRSTP